MQMNVTIRVINDVRTGISKTTGREYKNQDILVAWTERGRDGFDHENLQLVTLHGENVDKFAALNPQPGNVIMAEIAFGTRSFNGKVYNDNSMFV